MGAPTRQRHYDLDGNLVGVTEIESPWDDDARSMALAALAAEDLICHKCGNPRSLCGDPEITVWPQRSTCYVTAATEAADRRFRALADHKRDEAEQASQPRYYMTPTGQRVLVDGTHIWGGLADYTPEDDFV